MSTPMHIIIILRSYTYVSWPCAAAAMTKTLISLPGRTPPCPQSCHPQRVHKCQSLPIGVSPNFCTIASPGELCFPDSFTWLRLCGKCIGWWKWIGFQNNYCLIINNTNCWSVTSPLPRCTHPHAPHFLPSVQPVPSGKASSLIHGKRQQRALA